MFNPGDRITIVASGIPSGKLGLKVGSKGYVSSSDVLRSEYGHKYITILVKLSAVFSRFGFEHNRRMEEKTFFALYVISICDSEPQIGTTYNVIKAVNNCKRSKLLSSSLSSAIRSLGKGPEDVYVIGKNNLPVNMAGERYEFVCWFDSICRNEYLHNSHIIHTMLDSKRTKKPINIDVEGLIRLRQYCHVPALRKKFINGVDDLSDKDIYRIIAEIRLIHAVHARRVMETTYKYYDSACGQLDRASLKKVYDDGLLLTAILSSKDTTVASKFVKRLLPCVRKPSRKTVCNVIENYTTSRDYLAELAENID